MSKKTRWGILGTGYIAQKFAEALAFIPQAELTAVGSRSLESARAFGAQYHVVSAYGTYQEMVEDPQVDVVYVATVNSLHRQNCLVALQAGKAVLCEKPFVVNSAEAEEVIAYAHRQGLFLMEALWTRFIPAFVAARQMWESGVIGELRLVESEIAFINQKTPPAPLYDPALAGGCLLDMGAYPISLAHIVFGEPDRIASLSSIGASGVDEQTGMLFGYRGGRLGLGYASFQVESPKEASVVGTKGYIRIHTPHFCPSAFTLYLNGVEPQRFDIPYKGNGWNYEAVEVMQCLQEGKLESRIVPHGETLALMRTMDRIREQIGLKFPFEA